MAVIQRNNATDTTVTGTETADTITFTGRGNNIFVDGLAGDDSINATSAGVTQTYQNATINGGLGNDSISGFGSNTIIFAGQGADVVTLDGSGNNMTVFGGQNNDSILASSGSSLLLFGNLGNDSIDLTGAGDGNSVFGGQNDDVIVGGAGTNYLSGDLGNDTISSTGSSSTLFGGDGRDSITASGARSQVFGNQGSDIILVTASIAGTSGGDSISSADGTSVFGGQGGDVITVESSASMVFGNLDADTIVSSGATNTIFGGQGSDIITITALGDSELGDTVTGGNLIFGDLGNDVIDAGAAQRVTVNGGAGDDLIIASNDQAVLTGGAGADVFDVTDATAGETDTLHITDFVTGEDALTFSGAPATRNSNFTTASTDGGYTAARDLASGLEDNTYLFVAGQEDGYLFFQGATGDLQGVTLEGLNSINSLSARDILGTNQTGTGTTPATGADTGTSIPTIQSADTQNAAASLFAVPGLV